MAYIIFGWYDFVELVVASHIEFICCLPVLFRRKE